MSVGVRSGASASFPAWIWSRALDALPPFALSNSSGLTRGIDVGMPGVRQRFVRYRVDFPDPLTPANTMYQGRSSISTPPDVRVRTAVAEGNGRRRQNRNSTRQCFRLGRWLRHRVGPRTPFCRRGKGRANLSRWSVGSARDVAGRPGPGRFAARCSTSSSRSTQERPIFSAGSAPSAMSARTREGETPKSDALSATDSMVRSLSR